MSRIYLPVVLVAVMATSSGCTAFFEQNPDVAACFVTTGLQTNGEPCPEPTVCRPINLPASLPGTPEGFCASPTPVNPLFGTRINEFDLFLDLANGTAGQSGPVRLVVAGTKGELNVRTVELGKWGNALAIFDESGTDCGTASITSYPSQTTHTLPLVCTSATTAYVEADGAPGPSALDPTVTLDPGAAEGEPFIRVEIPAGGDGSTEANLNEFDALLEIELNAGVLTNPTAPGSYDITATVTSVDPGSGDLDDGIDPSPQSVGVTLTKVFRNPNPNTECASNPHAAPPPYAKTWKLVNPVTGMEQGPFALPYPDDPDALPVVQPSPPYLFYYDETNAYWDVRAAWAAGWYTGGACGQYHLKGTITLWDGAGLYDIPDPDPGVCGHGCLIYDDNTPNQAPSFLYVDPVWTMEAGEETWFYVEGTDERPGELSFSILIRPLGNTWCRTDIEEGSRAVFRCTPASSGVGNYSATVYVYDHAGAYASFDVDLNVVAPTETDPVLAPITPVVVPVTDPAHFPLQGTDPFTRPLAFRSVWPLPPGCVLTDFGSGTGSIDCAAGGTPERLEKPYEFVVTLANDRGETDQKKGSLTVIGANVPPEIEDLGDRGIRADGIQRFFTIDISDPNVPAQNLDVQLVGVEPFCNGSPISVGSGIVYYIWCGFSPEDVGSYPVRLTVTDDGSPPLSASVDFNINAIDPESNSPPVLSSIPNQRIGTADILEVPIRAVDPESDGIILFEQSIAPETCYIGQDNGLGKGAYVCWVTPHLPGVYEVVIGAADDLGAVGTTQFTLTVSDARNQPPQFEPIAPLKTYLNRSLNVSIQATDETPEAIILSIDKLWPDCSFTDLGNGRGVIDCPLLADTGSLYTDYPVVTASDGELSNSVEVPVTIGQPPYFNPVTGQTIPVETPTLIDLSAGGGHEPLTFSTQAATPAFCGFDDPLVATLRCQPAAGDAGTYTITIRVTDELSTFAETSFALTVFANQPPQFELIAPLKTYLNRSLNVSIQATDETPEAIILSIDKLWPDCSFTDLGNGRGVIDCPLLADTGSLYTDYPVVTASDGELSNSVEVPVTIGQPPYFNPVTGQTIPVETPTLIDLSAGGGHEPLTFSTQAATPAFCGFDDPLVATLRCQPAAGDAGTYTITIRVTDELSTFAETSFALTVFANQPPQFESIPEVKVYVGDSPEFGVVATDETPDALLLRETGLPTGCELTDLGGGQGAISCFEIGPDGPASSPRIYASDGMLETVADLPLRVAVRPFISLAPGQESTIGISTPVDFEFTAGGGHGPLTFAASMPSTPSSFCAVPDPAVPRVRCTAPPENSGQYHSVTVEAIDELGTRSEAQFQILVLNQPPRIVAAPDVLEAYVGDSLEAGFQAEDEQVELLEWSLEGAPADCGFSTERAVGPEALFVCAAAPALANDTAIGFKVTDSLGRSDERTVTLRTAQRPDIEPMRDERIFVGEVFGTPVATSGGFGAGQLRLGEGTPGFCSLVNNNLNCNPNPGDVGIYTVEVVYEDSKGTIVTEAFLLTVVEPSMNARPSIIAAPELIEAYVGDGLAVQFQAEDEDASTLVWTVEEAPPGCGFQNEPATGPTVTFGCAATPAVPGDTILVFTVMDIAGASDQRWVTLRTAARPFIEPMRDARVFVGEVYGTPVTTGGGFGNAELELGDGAPPFASLVNNNLNFSPGPGDVGTYTIQLIYTDSRGTSVSESLELSVLQRPAISPRITELLVVVGGEVSQNFYVSDDNLQTLRYTPVNLPDWCELQDAGPGSGPGNTNLVVVSCQAPGTPTPVDAPYTTLTVTDDTGLGDSVTFQIRAVLPVSMEYIRDPLAFEGETVKVPITLQNGIGPFRVFSGFGALPDWCEIVQATDGSWMLVCNPPEGSAGTYDLTLVVEDGAPAAGTGSADRRDSQAITLRIRDPAGTPFSELIVEKRAFDPATGATLNSASLPLKRGDPVGFELVVTNIGTAPALDLGTIEDVQSSSRAGRKVHSDFVDGIVLPGSTADWRCRFPGNGSATFTVCSNNAGTDTLAPGESITLRLGHRIADELATLEQDEVCDIGVVYWEGGARNARSDRVCVPVNRPDASFLEVAKTWIFEKSLYEDLVPDDVRAAVPFASLDVQPYDPGPGDYMVWYVAVTNTGSRDAVDISALEDFSDYVTATRRVIPNFSDFQQLLAPQGWDCKFVAGKLVRCKPAEGPATLAPQATLSFLFRLQVTDARPWPTDSELCNTANVSWEGNRLASNGGEDCVRVNSPGTAALQVTKELVDGLTGDVLVPPPLGFRPGELVDFRIRVTNSGPLPARGIRRVIDNSRSAIDSKGRTFPSFQAGGAVAKPEGWTCRFIRGPNRLECWPAVPVDLPPGDTLEFIVRMRISDPLLGPDIERICNSATTTWRDGVSSTRTCFPVTQNPPGG